MTAGAEPMTAFFIPNATGTQGETTYQRLRVETELRMGRPPKQRRISELWTRRGATDCITAVGHPDPICGDLVIAIFDMGNGMPFVVFRQDPTDPRTSACEVLGNTAYTVSEFVS